MNGLDGGGSNLMMHERLKKAWVFILDLGMKPARVRVSVGSKISRMLFH